MNSNRVKLTTLNVTHYVIRGTNTLDPQLRKHTVDII